MKVTKKQLEQLGALIEDSLTARGYTLGQWENLYVHNNIGKNPALRARWDALWAIPQDERAPLMNELYNAGCTDNHIDTALRHIFK